MCQATMSRLLNHVDRCQVRKVASVLTEPLSIESRTVFTGEHLATTPAAVQPRQTRRLAHGPLAISLLSVGTYLRFEYRPSQLGCDPHVRLFEQSQVLFEVPRGEAEAVQSEQDA